MYHYASNLFRRVSNFFPVLICFSNYLDYFIKQYFWFSLALSLTINYSFFLVDPALFLSSLVAVILLSTFENPKSSALYYAPDGIFYTNSWSLILSAFVTLYPFCIWASSFKVKWDISEVSKVEGRVNLRFAYRESMPIRLVFYWLSRAIRWSLSLLMMNCW